MWAHTPPSPPATVSQLHHQKNKSVFKAFASYRSSRSYEHYRKLEWVTKENKASAPGENAPVAKVAV